MKKILLALTFFVTSNTFAQSTEKPQVVSPPPTIEEDDDIIFQKVEVESEFIGGQKAWIQYLVSNLKSDVPGNKGAKKGKYTVIVKFTINREGNVVDVIAETKPGFGTEKEAVRLIKASPKWKPAVQNGVRVSSIKKQPITFLVE